MDHLPDHLKGLTITLTGVLVLTPDSLLVRLIGLDPWSLVFWRGLLMLTALGGFVAAYYRGDAWARVRAIGKSGVLAAASFAIATVCFVLALSNTSVANTLVIIAATPLAAALFSRLFLAEHVPPRTWAAILAAVAGIAVLVSGSDADGTLAGDLAALGCAIFVAGGLSIVRRARARNMVPAMALSGAFAALAMLPFAAPFSLTAGQAGLTLILGLVVLPVSFGLTTLGPRYLPAPEVGLIMLLETVLGPLWVWLAIGEEPGPRAFLGGAIVIAAVVVHSILALRRERTRVRART